jgi:Cu/Ag efflux protein CusF
MKRAITLALSAAAVGTCLSASALAAEQNKGMITGINRLNGTIAIEPVQEGTVGQSPVAEQYKVQNGAMLDGVHAGDRVTFSAAENESGKIITKLEKQK